MRSEEWRPAASGSGTVRPGRRRKAALRALRPGREELRCNRAEPAEAKVEAGSGERSAAPEPKIATVRAPGGGRPPYGDARRLARCLACPDSAGPTGASQAPERLSALRHPEIRVSEAKTKPRRKKRAAGTRRN